MQINVECPSCSSRFQLQADMVGKAIRCPECRETFVVRELIDELPIPEATSATLEIELPPRPVVRSQNPTFETGQIVDLLELVTAESVSDSEPPIDEEPLVLEADVPDSFFRTQVQIRDAVLLKTEAPATPIGTQAQIQEPVILEPAVPDTFSRTQVQIKDLTPIPELKEVAWSADEPPPVVTEIDWTKKMVPPVQAEVAIPEEPAKKITPAKEKKKPRRRRRLEGEGVVRKRSRSKLILLTILVLAGVGFAGYKVKQYLAQEPQRIFAKAKKDYEENRHAAAAKGFEELLSKHPKFEKKDEAKFFFELSLLKAAVNSLTNASNPQPALDQRQRFAAVIEADEIRPFAARDRFGADIWQTLVKLSEDVATKSKKDFDQDNPDETERWIQALEELKPITASFRPEKVEPEFVFEEIEPLRARMIAARKRLEGIQRIDSELTDPDDDRMEAARVIARNYQIDADVSVVKRLDDAEKKIQGRVVYKRLEPPLAPKNLKDDGLTGLLFAPRLDVPQAFRNPPASGAPVVYFGVVRGMLYALDESSGKVLWAMRVGIDCETLPLRVPANDTHPELVLVTVNDGTRSSLSARVAANGQPVWSQPLDTPCLGQPVLLGNRAFVPLRDKPLAPGVRPQNDQSGVILEVEINNGFLIGRLSLGRPLGTGAVRRPGTGLLYFTAESKGVYVYDMEKSDENGNRMDPQLLGILVTDHMPGTLRGEPVLANIDGDTPGPRFLILSQADGLNEMKLRAFPLPIGEIPKGGAQSPPVEIKLNGWSWFAPHCDGEKLAVVTDRGEFGLFGINQAGNQDTPLFGFRPDDFPQSAAAFPSRGQVVHAEEGTFWTIEHGLLYQRRLGIDAAKGLKLVEVGKPIPIGEPVQAPQVSPRRDAFVILTQSPGSSACVATAIDLRSGDIRWQRQLGMLTQGSPVRLGDVVLAIDRDCGMYRIDPQKLADADNAAWLLDDKWMLGAPLANVQTAPVLLTASDGKAAYALTVTESERVLRVVVRRYMDGDIITRGFAVPANFAGKPAICGGSIVIPLANGSLYRISLKELQQIEEGPTWRNERINPDALCRICPLNEEELLATDGQKSANVFHWLTGQNLFEARGKIAWTEKLEGEMVFIPGAPNLVCMLDAKGALTLWDPTKPGKPLRVWRSGDKGTLPAGPVVGGPYRLGEGSDRFVIAVGNRKIVCLSAGQDAAVWEWAAPAELPANGLLGKPLADGAKILLNDRAGWLQFVDLETGKSDGAVLRLPGGFATTGVPLKMDANRLLAPLSDGTLLLLPIKADP